MSILLPVLVFWPMAGGLICYGVGRRSKRARDWFAGAVAVVTLLLAALLLWQGQKNPLGFQLPGVSGLGLSFRAEGLSMVYGILAALLWTVTTVFSPEYFAGYRNRNRYYLFCLVTLGAALGVFFSADLLTTFVFFELLSLTSYALVAHDEQAPSLRAAETYLAVAIIGGMAMLMGLFLLYHHAGTLELAALPLAVLPKSVRYLTAALLLTGFGAKAGMFPLHIWLPKAHPVAPAPASALLSGMLTKTGVFGVLAVSWGLMEGDAAWGAALLALGVVTMVLGAVLALFSVDLKRTLACSSVSQIGFILVGAAMGCIPGEHAPLALRGTALHMVNHSLVKLVLFLAAGAVVMSLHRLKLNQLRGFGRGKPLFAFIFTAGALSLAGIPGTVGYLSKTLLHESIVEAMHDFHGLPAGGWLRGVEIAFLFTGGLTVAYMLKLFVVLFIEKGEQAPLVLSRHSRLLLAVCAAALPILGVLPLVVGSEVHFFAWVNLRGAVISLTIGLAVYFGIVRTLLVRRGEYVDRWPGAADLENSLYRPLLRGITGLLAFFARLADGLVDRLVTLLIPTLTFFARVADTLIDAVLRVILRKGLSPRPQRPFPGRFYARFYWLFHPRTHRREPVLSLTGNFSFSLALFGAGLCMMLVYALVSALTFIFAYTIPL